MRQEVYFARPQRKRQQEVEAVAEEPTNDADANQQEESAQQPDEAPGEKEEEANEDHWLHEDEVQDTNGRFEIVGNSTPSLDEDVLNWHRRQFEDEVTDAVNETDGYVESQTKDGVIHQRWQSSQSVFYESQELPGIDFGDDLESIEHQTCLQSYKSDLKQDTLLTSAQQQQSPTRAQSSQATSL